MEESVSELDRRRRGLLMGFIATFLLWQVPTILLEIVGERWSGAGGVLAVLAGIGAVAWLVVVYRLVRAVMRLKGAPEGAAALNDERVTSIRHQAFSAGFVALAIYLVLVRVVVTWAALPVDLVATVGVVLAAVTPAAVYLFMERETA